jgi:hypothetical protein
MSASQGTALDAVAFQIASTVERYEADVAALVGGWPSTEPYEAVNRHMDEIRMMSASQRELAVPFVTLLIAQAELVHCLWKREQAPECGPGDLQRCHAAVVDACRDLREACLWLVEGPIG